MTARKTRTQIIPIAFQNKEYLTLRGVMYVPPRFTKAALCAHGFPGDSSSGTHALCEHLAQNGVLAMRFDCTGSGQSDGKHEQRLLSTDITDLRAAIAFLTSHAEFDSLILIGHSTGATVAPFVAVDKHVSALILSSGVADLLDMVNLDFSAQQVRELWRRGHTVTAWPMKWSGKTERIRKRYYDEFFELDLPKALRVLRKPTLVVHGACDEAVPVHNASRVFDLLSGPKKLAIVPRADHRYLVNRAAYYRTVVAFIRGFTRLRARSAVSRARAASSRT